MYDAMGDVPGAFFRMMCENEAFDVESRPNKWGGGYCTEFPKFRQPFILRKLQRHVRRCGRRGRTRPATRSTPI
ncbi:MAG: hypothetical protein ACLTR5_01770 [Oscillospiraceae bacterium]